MRILVVDDEKIISNSLQRVLVRGGHEVMVANNGVDAIRILSEDKKFDLLFLDLLMPEIGGGEVLDFVKKAIPQAKVLMMTAYGDISVKEDLMNRGALRVLAKPFDDITLIPKLVSEL
ncbi:MAG: response regulator [Bdellovibrionota bacterium]